MKLKKFTEEKDSNWSLSGIYGIRHKSKPDTYYIGQTNRCGYRKPSHNGFYSRWLSHLRDLENNRHHNDYLQNAINKYGLEGLEFFILEVISSDKNIDYINSREQYYINKYNTNSKIYNFSHEYISFKGKKHTKESKKKMSQSRKGRKIHPNTLKAIIKANKNKIVSQHTRDKLSKANTGKVRSYKTRKKLSEAKMGKTLKSRRNIKVYNNNVNMIFDSYIEAAKYFDISKSYMRARLNKGYYKEFNLSYIGQSNRANNHSKKKIVLLDSNKSIVQVFESVKDCHDKLKISKGTIRSAAKNGCSPRAYPNMYLKYYNK